MVVSIEESTTENVSPMLESIIKSVTSVNKTPDSLQKDYLLILLIVSMIENGFLPVKDDEHCCEILDLNTVNAEQISKWKNQSGVYEVPLVLAMYKDTLIKLILSPLGAMALVNVVIMDLEAETYSVCLPMSKYVAAPHAATIPKIFRELRHFSITFKNKVLSAVKSKVLQCHGIASASLVGLPEEVFFKVMLNLPVKDVVNISKTCSRLRELTQSARFWHDMLKRDFQINRDVNLHLFDATEEYDWSDLYKGTYIMQRDKELARRRTAGTMHDYMEYADYVSYIDNPIWNVF